MKINNLFILVLCITLFAACKPKEKVKEVAAVEASTSIYKEGDKIQVLWGSGYYPSTVVEIGSNENAGKYKIHYEGWSSGSDEWVKTDRIRSADIQDEKVVPVRGSSTTTNTTTTDSTTKQADSKTTYKVGDKITAI